MTCHSEAEINTIKNASVTRERERNDQTYVGKIKIRWQINKT